MHSPLLFWAIGIVRLFIADLLAGEVEYTIPIAPKSQMNKGKIFMVENLRELVATRSPDSIIFPAPAGLGARKEAPPAALH